MQELWVQGTGPGFEQAQEVRRQVFVEEQGFSPNGEFDAKDAVSLHIVGLQDGVPVCTARIYEEGPGVVHMGRVAVLSRMRGTGVGLAMIRSLAERARQQGAHQAVLHSQHDKVGFYVKCGFCSTGKTSMDEGILHEEMILPLA